jgi:MFS family permease
MLLGASISTFLGFLVFFLDILFENIFSTIWLMPLIYFVLTVGYQGIRIGRKTYLVDLAEGNKRTDYVAVSNTIIGVILLFSGLIGVLNTYIGLNGTILLLAVIGLIGIITTSKLPDVTSE